MPSVITMKQFQDGYVDTGDHQNNVQLVPITTQFVRSNPIHIHGEGPDSSMS